MDKDYLVLKRASASRQSGKWNEDDFDVLADGIVVGRLFKSLVAPVGMPWLWALAFGTMRVVTRRAAMLRPARPRWRRSTRAGGGDNFFSGLFIYGRSYPSTMGNRLISRRDCRQRRTTRLTSIGLGP